MTATWQAPRTWTIGELVTKSILDENVRNNLEFLRTPPSSFGSLNLGADIAFTSTSFAVIDGTNLAKTITTQGGDVLVWATLSGLATGALVAFLAVEIDGVRYDADDGYCVQGIGAGARQVLSYLQVIPAASLSNASHTFKLMAKVSASTLTFFTGAGTGSGDVHAQMGVREFS